MKSMMKWLGAAALLFAAYSSAWAQLYSRGSEFGADTVVVDTRTGLSWLQLSQSGALTPTEIWASRSSNWVIQSGQYQGYRVAFQGEVDQLFAAYVSEPLQWSSGWTAVSPGAAERALELLSLFGATINSGADGLQSGRMVGNTIWGSFPTMDGTSTGLMAQVSPFVSRVWADNYMAAGNSTYLIAPVPEPATYALMLAGLGMLMVIARRRGLSSRTRPTCSKAERRGDWRH